MQVNPYPTFNGNCEEAFKTYQKILGGEPQTRHDPLLGDGHDVLLSCLALGVGL